MNTPLPKRDRHHGHPMTRRDVRWALTLVVMAALTAGCRADDRPSSGSDSLRDGRAADASARRDAGPESRRYPAAREDSSAADSSGSARPETSDAPTNASDSAAALAVLREYYAAISAHDYERAYASWGDERPPGRPTPAEFARGFAGTASVTLTIGEPGRIEGAAGSRYLEVPVHLEAAQTDGSVDRYAGTYSLRRSVVPGASAAQRRWHLYRAHLVRSRR